MGRNTQPTEIKIKMKKTEAIIEFCKECSGDQKPKDCTCITCQLYPFRLSRQANYYLKQKI
jgi:hypothetical protein